MNMFGWLGEERPDILLEALDFARFDPANKGDFALVGSSYRNAGGRYMLWELTRSILNADLPLYPQTVGSCVSHGSKHAVETLQSVQIKLKNKFEEWKPIYAPYHYGIGRALIGRSRSKGDGSIGVWQVQGCNKYGSIPWDLDDLPSKYNPSNPRLTASEELMWSGLPGPPQKYIDIGQKHLIKSYSKVTSWSQLVEAIANGYPVTIASNVGFQMRTTEYGYHRRQGSWAHQMCVIGVDDGQDKCACIQNSWGDVHGVVKDLVHRDVTWPKGTLRVSVSDIESILRQGDSWAYSDLDGFPQREIPWNVFEW